MARVAEAELVGGVGESPFAVVAEQRVAAAHRGDEQIGVAVVVEIGKGGGNADAVAEGDTGVSGDIAEASAALVLPQLVATELSQEVDVVATVAVDVGDRKTVGVIVVHRLHRPSVVLGDLMDEADAALADPIGEAEVVLDIDLVTAAQLQVAANLERAHADVVGWHDELLELALLGCQSSRAQGCRQAPSEGKNRQFHSQDTSTARRRIRP